MEYLLEIDIYDNIKNLLDKLKVISIDVDINNGISKEKREALWEADYHLPLLSTDINKVIGKPMALFLFR